MGYEGIISSHANTSMNTIINGNKQLIVCFGGMRSQFDCIPPFEFLNYLSSRYQDKCDLIFFIDHHQCWYHKGIKDITYNIDETVQYLNNIIKDKYDKIIFMGTSAGGYVSILFGSLCNNINYVISFIPQTILKNPIDIRYQNLKNVINNKTVYILHGDTSVSDINHLHHIIHCENIECFTNVKITRHTGCNLKHLRDIGIIKDIIDGLLVQPLEG